MREILITAGLAAYALFMIWHGMSMFRATSQSAESYFTGGRKLHPFVLLCTTSISIFSGLAFYGFPAAYYREGIGYYSAVGGYAAALMFVIVGYPLWKLGKKYGYSTPSDYLRNRYGSEYFGLLVAVVLIVFIIPYVALQLIAIGEGIRLVTNGWVPYTVAVGFGTLVVSLHIIGGGLKSVAWLDTLHVVLGIGTLAIILAYLTLTYFPDGGLSEAVSQIKSDAALAPLLSHPGPNGTFDWNGTLGLALSGAVATVVWPHVMMRTYLADNARSFVHIAWSMPIAYMLVHGMLLILGVILAPAILGSGMTNSDLVVPTLTTDYVPGIIAFLAILCLFAFAVSTADSLLLAASSIITNDVYLRISRNSPDKQDPARVVRFARLALVVLMIAILWVVWQKPTYIVDYAYKLSSPGFAMILPAVIGGLFWQRATRAGAFAGTLSGLVAIVVFTFIVNPPAGLSNILIGLIINTLFFVFGSLLTSRKAVRESQATG